MSPDVGAIIKTAIVTAFVSNVVQVLFYMAVQRRISRSDDSRKALEAEVNELKTKEVGRIEDALKTAAISRKDMYETLEDHDKRIALAEQELIQVRTGVSAFGEQVTKLERVATEVRVIGERVQEISLQQFQTAKELSAVTERIRDLRK